ncbi:MAG: hypothetical protein ACRCUU_09860 [Plesiomonas sp.]
MASAILNIKLLVSKAQFFMGLVEVDADPAAEYIAIFDRYSLGVVATTHVTPSASICKLFVPREYAESNNLVVGMFDNDLVFASVFADGLRATLVDTNA